MLIVDGFIEKQYPELAGLRQRVMVFKDFTFPGFKDGDARAKSLNGFADPPIRARPGEYQIWELGNLGADAFFDMKLEGHEVWVIERDGNLLLKPVRVDHVFLPPGARGHRGGAGRRRRHLLLPSSQRRHRPAGDPNPPVQLGNVHRLRQPGRRRRAPSWHACARGRPTPNRIQPNPNGWRKLKVDRTRYIDFSESADGNTFFINDKTYNENRVDTTTRVGRGRALDRAQLLAGDARLPPASDRVPDRSASRARRTRPWAAACAT